MSGRQAKRLRKEIRKHISRELKSRPWYMPAFLWDRIVNRVVKYKYRVNIK